jgi:hypothetical protein
MNWQLFLQLIVYFILTIVGWGVVHWLAARRDLSNERRKLRVDYLIDAYRRLEGTSDRDMTESHHSQLESAIADIQLFGFPAQVKMARDLGETIAKNGTAPYDELLGELRRSLRKELQIEPIQDGIFVLRIVRPRIVRPVEGGTKLPLKRDK